jgi:hypothetical protein
MWAKILLTLLIGATIGLASRKTVICRARCLPSLLTN